MFDDHVHVVLIDDHFLMIVDEKIFLFLYDVDYDVRKEYLIYLINED